jgi:hypothetical protein
MIDRLGTPDTYNHYPTGWAAAFSSPYRMFKRYSYQGDAVSSEYGPGFRFTGGRVVKVVYDVADDAYVDVERHLAGAMTRD